MALTGKIKPQSCAFHHPQTPFCISREGGKAGGAAAGIWGWDFLETLGLCHSPFLLRKAFLWEFRVKIHLFQGAVRVLLTQVVQWEFVGNFPFQIWIQLLSSSTFTLQRWLDGGWACFGFILFSLQFLNILNLQRYLDLCLKLHSPKLSGACRTLGCSLRNLTLENPQRNLSGVEAAEQKFHLAQLSSLGSGLCFPRSQWCSQCHPTPGSVYPPIKFRFFFDVDVVFLTDKYWSSLELSATLLWLLCLCQFQAKQKSFRIP